MDVRNHSTWTAIFGNITACYKQHHDQKDPFPESKSGDYLSQLRKSLQRRYPNASDQDIMAKCLMLLQGKFKSSFSSTENMSVDSFSSEPVQAGEAQNPDEDNPSTQDILDSAIELLRDKGKGHL